MRLPLMRPIAGKPSERLDVDLVRLGALHRVGHGLGPPQLLTVACSWSRIREVVMRSEPDPN